MSTSRRTAGLGLLAYGIGTAVAVMAARSPGGDYSDSQVAAFIARGNWVTAFMLAYLGAFAALGLIAFGAGLREELGRAGRAVWGLSVGGAAAGVVGWFVAGGVVVAAAEGGPAVASVPHPVIYVFSEIGVLLSICASAFLMGAAALVLVARARLSTPLRIVTGLAGVCGIVAPLYFPVFLFWLWAIGFGGYLMATRSRRPEPLIEVQPA